jgi:hypothetical protein
MTWGAEALSKLSDADVLALAKDLKQMHLACMAVGFQWPRIRKIVEGM